MTPQTAPGTCDLLADLLTYPNAMGRVAVLDALAAVAVSEPGLRIKLSGFHEFIKTNTSVDLEERFCRTFDVNPICSLEIGWHLFGEDYARGAFLVQMRGRMREIGVEEVGELPDHLTHALRLLDRIDDEEGATLARSFVLPALAKMLEGFKDSDSTYKTVLESIQSHLRARHGVEGPEDDACASVRPQPYDGCGTCPLVVPEKGSEKGTCDG
jgi:nitrate reductase assembly molybdenum cofactor insertion protein NarJ